MQWSNTAIKYIDHKEIHIVPPLNEAIRIQDYGAGIFIALPTKSSFKKAIKKNWITINGLPAKTSNYIKGGETLKLAKPKLQSTNKILNLDLEVIFEDEYIAAISKPPGILVSGNSFKTIANALDKNINPSSLPDSTMPYPVHRLDYPTTGVLLIGKTSNSIIKLNRMFKENKIDKTYYAITIGEMEQTGIISFDINNKHSETHYHVCKQVPSERFKKLNLVKLHPKTGRRHQIRKHLFSIGNPILGDKKYGYEDLILQGKGLYLHAYSIEFIHPFTNKKIYLHKNVPDKFNKIFPRL